VIAVIVGCHCAQGVDCDAAAIQHSPDN